MTSATRTHYETLVSTLESAYSGITVRRGTPRFGEEGFVTPSVSVYVARSNFPEPGRVSKGGKKTMDVRVVLACSNEPMLLDYIETYWQWAQDAKRPNSSLTMSFREGGRHINESGTELEDYGFEFSIILAW